MGVTGVERALTRRFSILILALPLEGTGAEDPGSDDVVIGVIDSPPVVELASKESLSLAMACAIINHEVQRPTADNPCKGSKLMVVRKPPLLDLLRALNGRTFRDQECTILFTAKQYEQSCSKA